MSEDKAALTEKNESRSKKSVLNTMVSFGFYLLNIIVTFVLRRVSIGTLGMEVTGMGSTISNLLGMLSLVELGLWSAVAYLYYKPLQEKDYDTINEIVSVQGWLCRWIGIIFSIGAGILMMFFPLIFAKAQVPVWMPYASFIAACISSLLSYFFNYRVIVLNTDQKNYKLNIIWNGVLIAKNILQVILLSYLEMELAYGLMIVFDVILSVTFVFLLEYILRREYPWLNPQPSRGKTLIKKYQIIIVRIRQLFIHKVAGIVLHRSSSVLIYGMSTLTMVAKYDNYMMLGMSGINLVNNFFNGLDASIGSLVAEGNMKKIMKFFWEMIAFRNFLAMIGIFGVLSFTHDAINLWIAQVADKFVPELTLFLLSAFIYLILTQAITAFTYAYGLTQDVWASIAEAIINLGFSLLLGYVLGHHGQDWAREIFGEQSLMAQISSDAWGLNGVIMGILISLLAIHACWKPYFLFTEGFKKSVREYWSNYIKYPLIAWGIALPAVYFVRGLELDNSTFLKLGLNIAWLTASFAVVAFGVHYTLSQGFRDIIHRISGLVLARFRR